MFTPLRCRRLLCFFVDSDFLESDGTFSANLKSDGAGQILCKVYVSSGCVINTPYIVDYRYTTSGAGWLTATGLAASMRGLLGVASTAIASGCVGWITVRGPVNNVQGAATSFTGSVGHAVYWAGATGLGASTSTYIGLAYQVGVLLEETDASTTANIYLTGNLVATAC